MTTHTAIDPLACAGFLLTAFVLAGVAHAAWLRSRWSRPLAIPIDGGRTLGGRRLFGDNKTVRGFAVMVPASAAAFALLAVSMTAWPAMRARLWPIQPVEYAALGLAAGLGFMAGELPNSFAKRRLGIPPGAAGRGPIARLFFAVVDRVDSIVGALVALALLVPVPAVTWLYLLAAGPAVHLGFSALLFKTGVKERFS